MDSLTTTRSPRTLPLGELPLKPDSLQVRRESERNKKAEVFPGYYFSKAVAKAHKENKHDCLKFYYE